MHRQPQERGAALASLEGPVIFFHPTCPDVTPPCANIASYPEFVLDTAVSARRLVLNH
jgi:hypothetical protein